MIEYTVEAKSRQQLRELANIVRESFRLMDELYFPIVELLDILGEVFPNFSYEIVADNAMPLNTHADTDILSGHIRIKESVYERACAGEGRDRMTIAHEFGHYFTLCFCGFRLQRNYSSAVPPYADPEWQAKCFAGELLMPVQLVERLTAHEIEQKCGVSYDAARYQYKMIHNER